MAGHSKWAQIKHKKAITDAKKSKLFSKLVREITVACKVGGANPEFNTRLRAAIERARAQGVSKDNIERAQTRGSAAGGSEEFKEFIFEAMGPGGIAILIEGSTDNTNRTVNEIKHLLVKHGGRLADPGSLIWNFQKIGILEIDNEKNPSVSENDMELLFIESGANNFISLENKWIVETDFIQREQIRKYLEEKHVIITSSGHDYKPSTTITLEKDHVTATEILIDALLEHDDIQEIYTNSEINTKE